jgi:hypothetical protein
LAQFHHAKPAIAIGPFQPDVITEMRDVDILLSQGLQYGQILIDLHFPAVDIYLDAFSVYN